MASRKLTANRIRTIMSRQFPSGWGPRYVPSQLATRGEAPSNSKPRVLHSERLQRELHAMSKPEAVCLALAMYHPNVFELKEQHALWMAPSEHPLAEHPRGRGMVLPMTSGTLHIAERLGLLKHHPKALEAAPAESEVAHRWIPGPLLGDLLLFVHDAAGPYCLHWDVKSRIGDHGRPGPGTWAERSSPRRIANAKGKDAIHVEYMRELGIRIVRMAKEAIDVTLGHNLLTLMEQHHFPIDLSPEVHADILDAFTESMRTGRPPNEVIDDFVQIGFAADQVQRVLVQGIWSRCIRIDLFRHWSIERPLIPESRDPLDYLAPWFRRQA